MSHELLNALKTADDVELPMEDAFYDRLHDKIMAGVNETEIKKLPPWTSFVARPKKYLKSHWKGWLGSSISMIALGYIGIHISVLVGSFIPESHSFKVVQNEQEFLQDATGSVENFSQSMINHQSQEDFLSDVASQRIEFSAEQLKRLKSKIN
ncbi:MAG: hypothetical protein AABY64_07630 [Bdellovibrionota bacterium]